MAKKYACEQWVYKNFVIPFLDSRDSEKYHDKARELLHRAQNNPRALHLLEKHIGHFEITHDSRLQVRVAGMQFVNPVLVGAGWDKSGKSVKGLYSLGFAGIEVGTVTRDAQEGNPKLRQFAKGGVALNRLGFNSPGMEVVARMLDESGYAAIPLGISLGKNKEISAHDAPEAHAVVARRLYDYATYFVVNVSSPNTPNLRELQDKGPLTDIVQAVNGAMKEMGGLKPLFVKIAPEVTKLQLSDVISVCLDTGLTGIIAVNTTTNELIKERYGWGGQLGGVSGDDPWYRRLSLDRIRFIYQETRGCLVIGGVGGIHDGYTARKAMECGADFIQVVSAIRGEGPRVAYHISRELLEFLKAEEIDNISDIVGSAVT